MFTRWPTCHACQTERGKEVVFAVINSCLPKVPADTRDCRLSEQFCETLHVYIYFAVWLQRCRAVLFKRALRKLFRLNFANAAANYPWAGGVKAPVTVMWRMCHVPVMFRMMMGYTLHQVAGPTYDWLVYVAAHDFTSSSCSSKHWELRSFLPLAEANLLCVLVCSRRRRIPGFS